MMAAMYSLTNWQFVISELTGQSPDGSSVIALHFGAPVQSKGEAHAAAEQMLKLIPEALFYTVRRIDCCVEGR